MLQISHRKTRIIAGRDGRSWIFKKGLGSLQDIVPSITVRPVKQHLEVGLEDEHTYADKLVVETDILTNGPPAKKPYPPSLTANLEDAKPRYRKKNP